MKNIRKHKKPMAAEAVARLADSGKDISRFLTNTGRMMGPIQRVNVDFASPMLAELDTAAKELNVSRQAVIKTLIRQALEAGARGYILKNAMDLDLVSAIKRVAKGQTVLDPQISRTGTLKGERDTGLTPRELEILQYIVAGKSNKEIASELNLSVNTVSVHRANIMDALGIHKTAELVVYAIRNGLVNLP